MTNWFMDGAPPPPRIYGILGLEQGAKASEIKRAFRREAKKHHPDLGGDPEQFKRLVAARDELLAAVES